MVRKMSETQMDGGSQGLFVDGDLLAGMLRTCIREVLEEEMSVFLGADRYERSGDRRGVRNGSKPRTLKTRVGKLEFEVPQARDGGFRPSVFDRYQRSEKALVSTMQEMVVQGVSTRRVSDILEAMSGFSVSAAAVSRAMAELDEDLSRFRSRGLGHCQWPYLLIDGRYEKVRKGGKVVSLAVLVAVGISDEGQREVLGWWLGDSESEATWSVVFRDLKARGLSGVSLVVSDAHSGIRAALSRHMQGAAWQRCRVHLMREMLKKVSWRDYRELAKDLRGIYSSEEREQCLKAARDVAEKWHGKSPSLSRALLAGVEDTLTVQDLPGEVRKKLYSTNLLERLMRSLKRRTRVSLIFPNEASCDRLIGALLLEEHEKWVCAARRYLNLEMMQEAQERMA